MKRFIVGMLLLAGCATPGRPPDVQTPSPETVVSHPPRFLFVYVPQTDEAAASWLKWFAKYPELRMVLALSPSFKRVSKDPLLKAQVQTLQKEGRLELALQIPNAPVLPLLVNTDSAKAALPPGSAVPSPSYAYPEDITQLVAQAKSDFFRQWGVLPRAFVLPYGAVSPALLSLLERLGFSWIVAALGAPAVDGPYRSGEMAIWDGAPAGPSTGTTVRVWDERLKKESPLPLVLQDVKDRKGLFCLPLDEGIRPTPLNTGVSWKPRTWDDPFWSLWVGQTVKNAGWESLRKTRKALEDYKNSGQASVHRLDAAFAELYSAQNSNYFSSMGSTTQSPALVEERQHEFHATLSSVYRLIGQPPPDDLFSASASSDRPIVRSSSTTARAEASPDGKEYVQLRDASGDSMGNGLDLEAFDVFASTQALRWTLTFTNAVPTSTIIDIYLDLNGQPNAGVTTFLPGRPFGTLPTDAWEYALSIEGAVATLYRTRGMGTFAKLDTLIVLNEGSKVTVMIPRETLRGSPRRWGYQVFAMTGSAPGSLAMSDLIDPFEMAQKDLWAELQQGKRTDIPFVRVRSR